MKNFMEIPQNINIEHSYDPAISLLAMYSKKKKTLTLQVHWKTICHSQDIEKI